MSKTKAKLAFIVLALLLAIPATMLWLAFGSGPFEYAGWSGAALNTRLKATTPDGSEVPDSVLQSRWLSALARAAEKSASRGSVTAHEVREMIGVTPTISRRADGLEFFECLSESVDCDEVVSKVPRYSPGYLVYPDDRSKLSMDDLNRLIGSRSYRKSELDRAATSSLGFDAGSTRDFESAISKARRFDIYCADKVIGQPDTIHRCYVFAYSDSGELVSHFSVNLVDEFVCDWMVP